MTANIINKNTGQTGYQIPGSSLQPGWEWNVQNQIAQATQSQEAKKPVTMLSTERAIPVLNTANEEQSKDITNLSTEEKNRKINEENRQKKWEEGARKQGGLTAEEIAAIGGDLNSYNFVAGAGSSGMYIPKSTTPAKDQLQTNLDEIENTFGQFQGLVDQSTNNLINSIKSQYSELANEQRDTNANSQRDVQTSLMRAGISRYAPLQSNSILTANANAGIKKLSEIATKQASAIAEAEQLKNDKSYELFVKKREEINTLKKDALAEMKKMQEEASALQKENRDRQQKITDKINEIAIDAKKNGAPNNVISSITSSTDIGGAVNAAGDYLQSGSGIIGEYQFYKRDAQARGLVPMSFDAYQNADANRKAKATGSSSGGFDSSVDMPVDPNSSSILAQTGLSMPAFAYLTKGTAALTRMTSDDRKAIMKEAQDWANKNGIDVSTFQSQYSALNKTVEANLLRNNQSQVAEAELDATLKNLSTAADDTSFTSMKWKNIVKMWKGEQFNDENVSKYSFHLNQLREEFAMYNAALAGQIDANGNIRQINGEDYAKAEQIIKDGFAKGSIQGFEDALTASRSKMQTVLQDSIDAQNKQVWKLFGVGNKFKSSNVKTTKDDVIQQQTGAKNSIDGYIKTNPAQAETVAKMYEVKNSDGSPVTDLQVYNALKNRGLIK